MSIRETLVTEPIAVANSVAALFEAVVIVLVTFGIGLTGEQVAAISAAIIVVGQTIATLVGRSKVSPI